MQLARKIKATCKFNCMGENVIYPVSFLGANSEKISKAIRCPGRKFDIVAKQSQICRKPKRFDTPKFTSLLLRIIEYELAKIF